MLAGVPTSRREVDPAAERNAIVDDHHLLMMAGGHGMRIVVADLHPAMRLPAQAIDRREFTIGPEDHRVVPDQHAYFEVATLCGKRIQVFAQQQ